MDPPVQVLIAVGLSCGRCFPLNGTATLELLCLMSTYVAVSLSCRSGCRVGLGGFRVGFRSFSSREAIGSSKYAVLRA